MYNDDANNLKETVGVILETLIDGSPYEDMEDFLGRVSTFADTVINTAEPDSAEGNWQERYNSLKSRYVSRFLNGKEENFEKIESDDIEKKDVDPPGTNDLTVTLDDLEED